MKFYKNSILYKLETKNYLITDHLNLTISMKIFIFLILSITFCNFSYNIRTINLIGNSSLGYYYLEAYIGSQKDKKTLILDTGSHMTILPC